MLTMADMAVRIRYTGETRPVELKQHGKVQQLTPNLMEQRVGSEDQRSCWSTVTAATAVRATATAVLRWLWWTKGAIN